MKQNEEKKSVITIPYNRPFLTGKELPAISEALASRRLSGNGRFTNLCQDFFRERLGSEKCLLTTSGTDALEMAAMLCDLKEGDEVIVPSFTFVSSALAFVREKARVVFADSTPDSPSVDPGEIERLITPRTRAVVVVHYAGVACDMDRIMDIARRHNLIVIEDAAQAFDSFYKGRPLGSIGDVGCFSFHETKNVIAGEGGLLAVNNPGMARRCEILWEKGTNRSEFFRGEVNKYGWVDTGSSFLPAEIVAAFLYAQLSESAEIQKRRLEIWNSYLRRLKPLAGKGFFEIPEIPDYASGNGHIFYILCRSMKERSELIDWLKSRGIQAVFHYLSLHKSEFYKKMAQENDWPLPDLPNCDRYADTLLRLPLYCELTEADIARITTAIQAFYTQLSVNSAPCAVNT